ncbi:MAG: T9SS type A sorting domain-containing protein [Sphingobacteriales bacterium]|jgi:hypothetical protein|nr:T9SS type A sorting domain-containing protein [Sphingobacteriales bacterium]MBP9141008.1 T9SS type A sorting domain-containing protein [Chitinophagales bacterium]MDA0197991.1 T9SS type A sorting domain-containing protein [Bacteroidota bacterium]MBK6889474.1 T9SS type A sorting domain-containing protein [Sphingobacteriales bacterium]MBK7528025.1 T9SS type A sorting domain-containing protein [Sphingobacteriales bacterium]
MKYLILLTFAIGWVIAVKSQPFYYFNKEYIYDTLNTGAPACMPLPDGYLIAGPFGSYNFTSGIYVRKLSLAGDNKWFKYYFYGVHDIYTIEGEILAPTTDGNFILVSGVTSTLNSGDGDIVMIKFDKNGNALFTATIEQPETHDTPGAVLSMPDSTYIIAGTKRKINDPVKEFYVLRTNAAGQKIWDTTLHTTKSGLGASLDYGIDGGYIASGYINPNSLQSTEMYVAKFNDQNKKEWEFLHGTPESDNGCHITKANDNTYLITGGLYSGEKKRCYIAKLSSEGSLLWEQEYIIGAYPTSSQAVPRKMPGENNGYIGCLLTHNGLYNYYPVLIRYTEDGDTLWTKKIPGIDAFNDWYIKDIEPTYDGGFLLSGFNYTQQSSWVVKIDTLGETCEYLGCFMSLYTGIENSPSLRGLGGVPTSAGLGAVTPNPAHQTATLTLNPNYTHLINQGETLEIFNIQGQLVKTIPLSSGGETTTFTTANLISGIYYCRLQNHPEIEGVKMVLW